MRLRRLITVVLACGYGVLLAQMPVKFARFPAPSPDGTQLAFSWQGDLWVVPIDGGLARRLTVHPAYDFAPLWSPDGTKLAFTSDRHGNDDVFVLDLVTGEIQRLTWFSGRDRALGWLPDSSGVVFESRRDWEPYGVDFVPYVALLKGGTPYRLHDVEGTPVALAPDGKRIAFVRRDSAWWRKGYKGSAQGDLWLGTLGTKQFTRLTNTDTPDTMPLWSADGRTLYFVSERDGARNLYAMDIATKRVRPLTDFKGDGVRFPQINAKGTVITFEQGMEVWKLDLATGKRLPIAIEVPAMDSRTPTEVIRTFSANVSEYAIAPEGKEVAFIVRGELFVTRFPEGGAPTPNLTKTVEPEEGIAWSKDGKWVYFAGERNGQTDLFRITSDDPEEPRLRRTTRHKIEPLTQTPQSESRPTPSPDGKWLAFERSPGNLVVMNLETREERTLVQSWNLGNFVWSPDSKWLAYDMYDENYNADVWVVSIEGGTPVNLSRHPRNDFQPSWSADGRAIVFLSERDGDSINIYHLYLRREDYEKTRADREDEEDYKHDAPKKTEEKKDEPTVQIDFEDIHLRIRAVTRFATSVSEAVVGPDGEQIAFVSVHQGQSDLYLIKADGTDERRLTTGGLSPSSLRWSKDGKTLYFLSRGRIQRIATSGGTPQATNTEVRLTVNEPQERAYLFETAWRTLNETFYDPKFHGVDWQAMREKYRPYLPFAQSDRDFTAVVLMMLGELNSSHLSFSKGGGEPPASRSETGMLGVVFSNAREGEGLLIEHVVPNTPASRKDVNLQPGERIIAVNNRPITSTTNIWQLLDNTVGERVELRVRQPDGSERTVFLRPISVSAYNNARYQEWVAQKRKYVEQKTGGRLGYVHIQAMGEQSLREFERDLYAVAYGKQGLVIDVRFNSGGRTADFLLGMLSVPRHAYTVGREGKPGYPQDRLPLVPWNNPIVVLCNEQSFSNAEIFAHAIKTLKRGPLVGLPTAGGVISTGSRTLIDGSRVSTPGRGWYTIDKHVNLEGNGAQPDYLVEDMPEDLMEQRDRQLDKAIEVLLDRVR